MLMLLKLSNHRQKCFILFLLCHVLILKSHANDLNFHGFIAQGIAKNPDSDFISDDDNISFDLTEIGLNFSYQYTPTISFAGQAVYLNGGNRFVEGAKLDYLLVDWNFYRSESTQSHLYAGRIKNLHWLYSSTRDVPVTRPSIILPQSIYLDGARDLAIGGDGIAFSHSYSTEALGEFDFTISSTFSPISADDVRNLIGDFSRGRLEHIKDLQASLYWHSQQMPLSFGVAVTDATFDYEKGDNDVLLDGRIRLKRFYLNMQYLTEKWTFSSELIQEQLILDDLLFPNFSSSTIGQGGFVQTQYRAFDLFEVLIRYERYYANKDDRDGEQAFINSGGTIPAYFSFQHDFTVGFSYEFTHNLKLDIEHHWINGTARLTPIIIPNVVANPQARRQLTVAQLSYWF